MELAERAEQASGPERELDARIAVAINLLNLDSNPSYVRKLHRDFGGSNSYADIAEHWPRLPHYTASLDAAMGLTSDDTPEIKLNMLNGRWRAIVWIVGRNVGFAAEAATAPLALTAAALRALAAKEDHHG